MKNRIILAAALCVSSVAPLRAAEAVPGTAGLRIVAAEARPLAKITYCGVGTSEVTPALSSHLKLPASMGLMVDWVEPGSPADLAGIKQYDVLIKFNDQKLVNPEQFRALVRLKKPSDDLKLELIRQGQPTSAHVELGQTQRAEAPADLPAVANGGTFRIATSSASGHAANANVFFQRAVPAPEGPLGGGQIMVTNTNGQSQTQWSDDQHTLQLEKSGDQPLHLIARDKAGKELFNGPVETPEQLKALSPDLTAKLARAQATLPGTITAHAMTIRAADFINGAVRFEIVNEVDPQGAITVIDPGAHMGVAGTKRARVLTSTQKQTLIVARMESARAAYLLAFDTSTGKTLFDGPVVIPAQRKSLPGLLSEQLDVLEKNQADAPEFGTMGR